MSLKTVFEKLQHSNSTVSFIESCTGGGLAQQITALSGASDLFVGGLVPYQDETKSQTLGISLELIKEKTAVSPEVVKEMALRGRGFFSSTWCLATSGWAGPSGGTIDDPVGTVYFAVCGPGFESLERRTFKGSNTREFITRQACDFAWEYLSKVLEESNF